MFAVRITAEAGVYDKPPGTSHRDFNGADLAGLLARCMSVQDVVAAEAIGKGPLLFDYVRIGLLVTPAVNRARLTEAWLDAVSQIAGLVQILPEAEGQNGSRPPDRSDNSPPDTQLPSAVAQVKGIQHSKERSKRHG
jgi:hypothetical protein